VVECLRPLLEDSPTRATMIKELEAVQAQLKRQKGHSTAADRAADAILKVLNSNQKNEQNLK
jgi:hypothetical protein